MTQPTQLTLLTQLDCGYCEHAKAVLGRLSAEFEFTTIEVDLTSDVGRELAIEHAVLFAPGLLINGEMFGHGRLSERKLRKTLSVRKARTPSAKD